MATTKTKKNTSKKEVVAKSSKTGSPDASKEAFRDEKSKVKTHPLIKGPRVTEKSALDAERGVYTFNVAPNANKNEIKKAIKFVYGVTPQKISVTTIAKKKVTRRGIVSVKQGGKKMVVHLKKGDKIIFA